VLYGVSITRRQPRMENRSGFSTVILLITMMSSPRFRGQAMIVTVGREPYFPPHRGLQWRPISPSDPN
jgi:hypothetical protein